MRSMRWGARPRPPKHQHHHAPAVRACRPGRSARRGCRPTARRGGSGGPAAPRRPARARHAQPAVAPAGALAPPSARSWRSSPTGSSTRSGLAEVVPAAPGRSSCRHRWRHSALQRGEVAKATNCVRGATRAPARGSGCGPAAREAAAAAADHRDVGATGRGAVDGRQPRVVVAGEAQCARSASGPPPRDGRAPAGARCRARNEDGRAGRWTASTWVDVGHGRIVAARRLGRLGGLSVPMVRTPPAPRAIASPCSCTKCPPCGITIVSGQPRMSRASTAITGGPSTGSCWPTAMKLRPATARARSARRATDRRASSSACSGTMAGNAAAPRDGRRRETGPS